MTTVIGFNYCTVLHHSLFKCDQCVDVRPKFIPSSTRLNTLVQRHLPTQRAFRSPCHRERAQLGQGSGEQTSGVCDVVIRVCADEEEFELFVSRCRAGRVDVQFEVEHKRDSRGLGNTQCHFAGLR